VSTANFIAATLINRTNYTDNLAVFELQPTTPFVFRPGQCATLAFLDGEKPLSRPYSIASPPAQSSLEFYVELITSGQFTPRLWSLTIGNTLWLRHRAVGVFTLLAKPDKPHHLMVASATGITPYVSMVSTALAQQDNQNNQNDEQTFTILHFAPQPAALAHYADKLHLLASQHPQRLNYQAIIYPTAENSLNSLSNSALETTAAAVPLADQLADAIATAMLSAQLTRHNTIAYACGHPQIVELAQQTFLNQGFDKTNLRTEKYFI
jgi:ferredoxin/flavodoxin---NADP+ reductase